MKPEDYAKLLLESSFKESDNMWKRSAAILTFQSVIIGFFANNLGIKPIGSSTIIILTIVGLISAVFSYLIACVSEHYNLAWFNAFLDYTGKQSQNARLAASEKEVWDHVASHLKTHEENMPFPKWHSSKILKIFSVILASGWIIMLFASLFNLFRGNT